MRRSHHLLIALLATLAGCAGDVGAPGRPEREALAVGRLELDGAPQDAARIAEDLAAGRADDPDRLVLLGDADTRLGRTAAATEAFRRALAADPGSVPAALGLARLHLQADPAAALGELRTLAARVPRNAHVLTDLAVAEDLVGQPLAAQGDYRRAMSLDPELVSAQVDLGLSLAISGHPSDALGILGPLAAAPDATARVRQDYAVAAVLAGHADAASAVLGHDMPLEEARSAIGAYQAFADGAR